MASTRDAAETENRSEASEKIRKDAIFARSFKWVARYDPRHARARRGHPRLYGVRRTKDVDGRNKSGHDGGRCSVACSLELICYTLARSYRARHSHRPRKNMMSNGSTLSLSEIEDRIAIVRDNIRQLIEQAAAFSGAEDEERNADRIAQQTEELDGLVKQRDALLKK
jgi:hypothetical protein